MKWVHGTPTPRVPSTSPLGLPCTPTSGVPCTPTPGVICILIQGCPVSPSRGVLYPHPEVHCTPTTPRGALYPQPIKGCTVPPPRGALCPLANINTGRLPDLLILLLQPTATSVTLRSAWRYNQHDATVSMTLQPAWRYGQHDASVSITTELACMTLRSA